MTREIRIEGAKELLDNLNQYGKKAQQEARKATARTAIDIHAHAVKAVQSRGNGRVYTRGPGRNLSATHQASAPGEPPATDTGRLVSSLVWRMDGDGALIGSTVRTPPYPMFLEFGTRNMEARPFMRPALDAHRQAYLDRLKDIHDKALR